MQPNEKEPNKERNHFATNIFCFLAYDISPRMRHCLPPPCYGHRLLTSVWILQFIGTNCVCSACEMSAHSCSHFSKETLSPLWVLCSGQRPAPKNRFLIANFKLNKDKKFELYFIMGADNLINFHKWYKWKSIIKKCNLLVFDRQGYKAKSLKSVTYNGVNKNKLSFINFKKVNISSSQLRKI